MGTRWCNTLIVINGYSMVLHFDCYQWVTDGVTLCYQWVLDGVTLWLLSMGTLWLVLFDWRKAGRLEQWPPELCYWPSCGGTVVNLFHFSFLIVVAGWWKVSGSHRSLFDGRRQPGVYHELGGLWLVGDVCGKPYSALAKTAERRSLARSKMTEVVF